MSTFQVQKVLNSNFSAWRTSTFQNIPTPYEWAGLNGFGVANITSGSYTSGSCLQTLGKAVIYSHFIPTNVLQSSYTLQYDASGSVQILISQYDTDLNPILTTQTSPTGSWNTRTFSIVPNSSSVGMAIRLSGSFSISNIKLLGPSITLPEGFMTPVNVTQTFSQKSSTSYGGSVVSAGSYTGPLRSFALNVDLLNDATYSLSREFLYNPDVNWTQYPIIYTADDNTSYFGHFSMAQGFTQPQYKNYSVSLTFQEMAY